MMEGATENLFIIDYCRGFLENDFLMYNLTRDIKAGVYSQ
jgi:hypothetical protein